MTEIRDGYEGAKEEKWQATVEKLNRIETEYDYPIDEKVRELVIALNAFDIPTLLSCEGHVDENGTPGPFVSIGESHLSLLQDPDVKEKAAASNLALFQRLNGYLHEFNEDREVPLETQLILELKKADTPFDALNNSLLHNRGQIAFQTSDAPSDVKKQQLGEFQKEIKDFGGFLKSKFLSHKISSNKVA